MGVILFELVTGGTDQFRRRPARELAPSVPLWLDELIERCTDRDPARRFRTLDEVSAELLRRKGAAQE
jgi:serine/threonine protein kinase